MEKMPFGVVLRYWVHGAGYSRGWNLDYVELAGDDSAWTKLVLAIDSIKKQGSHVSDVFIVSGRISGLESDMETQQTQALQKYFPDTIVRMLRPNKPSASSPTDDGKRGGNGT